MTVKKAIMHALEINPEGQGVVLQDEDVTAALERKGLVWVHLDGDHPDTRGWLAAHIPNIDELIMDALLAVETRPRHLDCGVGTLLILRGVNLNKDADPEDMVSIRMWVDDERIISVRRRHLRAVQDIYDRLLEGKGPKTTGEFITALTSRLFERMEPVFGELDERLDDIEEVVMENPDPEERQEITNIRKQAIIFRRYIAPQRDVIAFLRTAELSWLSSADRRRLQENLDRVMRYIEDLDSIRERAQIIKDELANMLSDRLNKNLYILSVIAAVFLPLGFLTGLLGINIGGIPGADNPHAFYIFDVILIGIVAAQVIIFKKLKWF